MKPASSHPANLSRSPLRRSALLRASVIVLLVTGAAVFVAAPAQAAAYRFWGYFHLDKSAWTFAQKGPAESVPTDGSVEGWRYAVADESSTRTPRAKPAFDELCAAVKVAAGKKRVGLVIDYGRKADSADNIEPPAPRATCVAVPEKATGSDILVAAGATLRLDKALTCGIDGWPATDCGGVVNPVPAAAASPDVKVTIAAPTPSATTTLDKSAAGDVKAASDNSSTSKGLLIGGPAVIVILALGIAARRRSRDTTDD